MGKKKAGKEAGSKLLRALGRTKKEQMKVLYPKAKTKAYPKIKSKGPYTRGKVMGAGDLITRRATIGGTKFPTPTKKKGIGIADIIGAGAAGWAVGSGQHKKAWAGVKKHFKKKDTHLDKAREGAKSLVQKQKEKKGKRENMKEKLRKMVGPRKKTHHD